MPATTRTLALAAAALAIPCAAIAGKPDGLAIFAFDQGVDNIYRFMDLNGDGDALDPGEIVIFFGAGVPQTGTGNSQGLLAVSPTELYATDNFPPDDIVHLVDLNGDGDAFDAGENSRWWTGGTPYGTTITNLVTLSPGPEGSFAALDNNVLDTTVPCALYLLSDLNMDGDVNDPGEVTVHFELGAPGSIQASVFDAEFDNSGAAYIYDTRDPNQIEHIDRIDPTGATRVQWLRSDNLFSFAGVFFGPSLKLEHNPVTDEIIAAVTDLSNRVYMVAFRDRNGSGAIDSINEVRLLWSEGTNADGRTVGAPRDFVLAEDGSLIFVDAGEDQIVRLRDLNGDGDYNDLGESVIVYKASLVGIDGPVLDQLLSVAAAFPKSAPPCPADLDGDGAVGAADLAALLGSWGASGPADLDGDGAVGASDLAALLGSWGPCL